MWDKIDAYVDKHQLIQNGDVIVTGVSGGADSICLLRYLLYLKEKKKLTLYGVHVNHMLRGEEADRDEAFVRKFCDKWKIPLYIHKRNVKEYSRENQCSIEEAGRKVRYEIFRSFARQHGCNKIAVAHHENDLAETVLFRMVRGTGLKGLSGILPLNGDLIRPLLCLQKSEVLEILDTLKQDYMEDSTNIDEDYSRNFIRRRVIPELEQMNSGAVGHLGKLAGQAAELFSYLKPILAQKYKENVQKTEDGYFLKEQAFLQMHEFEQKEILRQMLFEISGQQKDISSVHVEQLSELFYKKEGKRQDFPYGVRARKESAGVLLYLDKPEIEEEKREKSVGTVEIEENALKKGETVFVPFHKMIFSFCLKEYDGGEIVKKDCIKYFDYGRIKCKMCLRTRRSGDYFIMDKNGRHKSLNRYFIDEKIPSGQRDHRPLLADGAHIMWVPGGRISEEYKIRPETKQVLVVKMERRMCTEEDAKKDKERDKEKRFPSHKRNGRFPEDEWRKYNGR